MRTLALTITGLLGLAACGGPTVDGQLVDALQGDAPIAGEQLRAQATDQVRMTCQRLVTTTDEGGHFSFDGLCLTETTYELQAGNTNLFLAEVEPVGRDATSGSLRVRAWRAPVGSGLYHLSGADVASIPSHAELGRETILNTEETVEYPRSLPDDPPLIEAGDYLVLTGRDTLDRVKISPLVHSGERRFGTTRQPVEMRPWWFVGTRFESDTEFERVEANPNVDGVLTKERGDRVARFIAGSALPEGRYLLRRDNARRAHIVDFGVRPDNAEAPAVSQED